MAYVVIPWFLVVTSFGVLNNTDVWTDPGAIYEPEPNHGILYVYSVDIDFSRSLEKNEVPHYGLNLASTLSCRARNASVLSCIFDKGRLTVTDYKRHAQLQRRFNAAKESFEIDFNEAGVESIRVPRSLTGTSNWENGLIIVKIIASQLNVGTDLSKHKSFAFTTNETSSLGECETVFVVLESTCPRNATRDEFRLRSSFDDSLGDSVVLRKRRNTRNCDRPNEVPLIENNESIVPTVTSSYSEMSVCPDSFESTTIVEGKAVGIIEDAHASVFRQVVKLRLESVERVEDELPPFDANSAIDRIYLHKDVDNNDFET